MISGQILDVFEVLVEPRNMNELSDICQMQLRPVFSTCSESFQFGNGEVTRAVQKVYYPDFLEGVYRGVLDQAEVPVDCPMLLSKMVLRKWDADMCFGKGVTRLNKFNVEVPFSHADIPVINILDVTAQQVWEQ